MITAPESESAALAHERTPLLCSPSPIISTRTSIDDSDHLKPVETRLGLPANDVACAKSGTGAGPSKGFGGVVAVMLLGSLSLLNHYRLYHHAIFLLLTENVESPFNWWSAWLSGVFISSADNTLILATSGTISSELGNLENQSWLVVSYSFAICAIQPAVCYLMNRQITSVLILDIEWERLILWSQSSSMENWAIYMAERPCWSPPMCYLPSGPPYRTLWHIGWWREC